MGNILEELFKRRTSVSIAAMILSSAVGLVLGWPSPLRMATIASLSIAAFGIAIVLGGHLRRISDGLQSIQTGQEALWSLSGMYPPDPKVLPAFGSGGIRPPAALALAQTVVFHRPRVVVELGPGASSILIIRAAASVPYEVSLTAIEHDASFYDLAARTFEYLDLNCNLILAPLESWEGHGYKVEWYARDRLIGMPKQIDLLIVDGPPGHDGVPRRFPAFPMLREVLSPGALVFVDDTDRQEERKSVEDWCRLDDELRVLQDRGSFVLLKRG